MSADTESDVWERAVCAFCGAVLGGVAGFAVEMLRAATVGAPMSIAVVGIFVLIGAVLGAMDWFCHCERDCGVVFISCRLVVRAQSGSLVLS
jgi:hypothetical protein